MTDTTDDRPLSPEAMLRLAESQEARARRAGERQVPWYLGVWGGAWLLGYLALAAGWGTRPLLPSVVASVSFAAAIVLAFAISMVVGIRMNRGVRGGSEFRGMVYGLAWPVLSVSFGALGAALIQNGMTEAQASLYFPSVYALMVGALYLAGAAMWHSRGQLVLGIVMVLAGALSPFFGSPGNLWVMAAAGVLLLVAGSVYAVRLRRA